MRSLTTVLLVNNLVPKCLWNLHSEANSDAWSNLLTSLNFGFLLCVRFAASAASIGYNDAVTAPPAYKGASIIELIVFCRRNCMKLHVTKEFGVCVCARAHMHARV